MIRNYITIAYRNIKRNVNYTIINVAGLALGITCSIVLFLLIAFLTSFDNYHAKSDRIYRIVTSSDNNGRQDNTGGVPSPLPEAVRNDFTGVESVLFISGKHSGLVSVEDNGKRKMFEEGEGMAYTDSMFFYFFNRKLLSGHFSLDKPNEAVISTKWAKRYFNDEDPIGKSVTLDNDQQFIVTGVMADYPANTNFPFDLLMSFETIKKSKLDEGWGSVWSDDQCYLMLSPGTKPESINDQMPAFVKKYNGEENSRTMKRWLQPLKDIHHDTRFSNYSQHTIGKESIYAMGVVAIFLLITACINFINLTTAVAVRRSKEVGIRKVLGSQQWQLLLQYLSETSLITLMALIISVGLAELALINLNVFLEMDLHIDLHETSLWLFMLSVWIGVSLISGLYPAFLLTGFNPVQALKNKLSNRGSGGFFLRRGLVVFQFIISQFLIVGTVILLKQMDYFNSKDLGFAKEAIITVPLQELNKTDKKFRLKEQLNNLPGVDQVSLCSTPPSSGSISITDFEVDGVAGNHNTQIKLTDQAYLDLFELKLVAGRSFDPVDTTNGWIVNERLSKLLEVTPEELIGRNLTMWDRTLPVIGVVSDFHTTSLAREIEPTTLFKDPEGYRTIAIKLKEGQVNQTIKSIESLWSAQYPDFLFSYTFLDEDIAQFYDGARKMSVLLAVFASMAIVIGCLGLYGLISFMAAQKEKEIGIRKVLGASVSQIMLIFSREFTVLITIAFVFAGPLAGLVMNKWLENFAYRTPLGWTIFLTGILTTLVLAFVTVGYRSIRAATSNPVHALRNE